MNVKPYLTPLGVACRDHRTFANDDEPCWACERKAHVARAIEFLLISIGSWTAARFDQHLSSQFGDESTSEVLVWLKDNVSEKLGPGRDGFGQPRYCDEKIKRG